MFYFLECDDVEPVNVFLNKILDIDSLTAENYLFLNQDETEVLTIGPEDKTEIIVPELQHFLYLLIV